MKLVEEITSIEQDVALTVDNNEFNYGTTIPRNYLVNQQFPHHMMKYNDYTK